MEPCQKDVTLVDLNFPLVSAGCVHSTLCQSTLRAAHDFDPVREEGIGAQRRGRVERVQDMLAVYHQSQVNAHIGNLDYPATVSIRN